MATPNQREWNLAMTRGAAARQAGRPITAVPERGADEKSRLLREAWESAWRVENVRRQR